MRPPVGLEFTSLTISFFSHSTEDSERLLRTVLLRFGISNEDIVSEDISGHYGNLLTHFTAHLTGERATAITKIILSNLDQSSKEELMSELDKHLDEHDALFLRVDRQELAQRLVLGDEEPIRIKLKPRSRSGNRKEMIEAYASLIGVASEKKIRPIQNSAK